MAGDWIKVEKATPTKMKVLAISEYLEIHPAHAFGLCVKFWMWCDDHLTDGNAKRVTKKTLDYVIGHDGMTDALLKVDWLRDRSGSLEVPHFDRHLSEGAKNRALTKERVRKSKAKSNETSVAQVTQAPLLEKRREEKKSRERPPTAAAAPLDEFSDEWEDKVPESNAQDFHALTAKLNRLDPRWKPAITYAEQRDIIANAKFLFDLTEADWNLLTAYMHAEIPDSLGKFYRPPSRGRVIQQISDLLTHAADWQAACRRAGIPTGLETPRTAAAV